MNGIFSSLSVFFLLLNLCCAPQQNCPALTRDQLLLLMRNGTEDQRIEASAIEPISEDMFIVADDRKRDLWLVNSKGVVINSLPMPADIDNYAKWEAMAKDGDDYYVIGSHQDKRWSNLVRFQLKKDMSIKEGTLKRLTLDFGTCNLPNHIIEGLTVRQGQLIVGLREDSNRARICGGPIAAGNSSTIKLERLFSVQTPRESQNAEWHLSSLEYLPGRGYLLLTSTEYGDNKFDGNKLWFISDAVLANPKLPIVDGFKQVDNVDSWCAFQPDMKAEGLAVVKANGNSVSAVIVFDNDYPHTLQGSRLQFITLNLK